MILPLALSGLMTCCVISAAGAQPASEWQPKLVCRYESQCRNIPNARAAIIDE
jgi:hypothetical protein